MHRVSIRGDAVKTGQIAANLAPGLVDAGELSNGAPYLVMKYVGGAYLSQILATSRGGLEPVRVADIMRQAGQGVAALHEAGLVHRDIKPGNFVVSDNDQKFPVKVIDLGIVRVLGTSTCCSNAPWQYWKSHSAWTILT